MASALIPEQLEDEVRDIKISVHRDDDDDDDADSVEILNVGDCKPSTHLDDTAQQSTSRGTTSKNDHDKNLEETEVKIRKIFVGNLNPRISANELHKYFAQFGEVQNAHFARNKDGARESFAFVTFYNPDDAQKALFASQRQRLKLCGSSIIVNKAELKHQPKMLKNGKIRWNSKRPRFALYESVLGNNSRTVGNSSARYGSSRKVEPPVNTNDLIDESKCVAHLLNDDCLMHIFSFLSKVERIKCERVCKRWQTLCIETWLSTKRLDFEWLSAGAFGKSRNKYPYLNAFILEHVLSRCGPNLNSLDISYKYTKLREKSLTAVVRECPNLSCLNLTNFSLSIHGITLLKPIGASLRRLVLESIGCPKEPHVKILFESCPHLTSVVLSSNSHLTGECLRGLNKETLEELIIDSCNGLRPLVFGEVLATFKNLQRLSMNSCISLTSGILDNVFKSLPQLKSLSLGLHFPLMKSSSFKAISHLTNLVTLTVFQNSSINDEVMKAISKNCKKIEFLDITGCSVHTMDVTLSNAGIADVAQLPKLTTLKMSYMATLTDQALVSLAEMGRLKSLECRGTPTFTDFGLCRLVELCTELEHLDVSGCNFVSDKTVTAAIAAVKLRTNNVKLKLIGGATAIWMKDVNEPLFELDGSDLSVDCHRPDYVDDVYFFSDSDDDFEDMDGIDQFDWECQSMFLGDDIGELIFANQFLRDSDDDSDFDDGLYFY